MSCLTPVDCADGVTLHTVENGNAAAVDDNATDAYGASRDTMCMSTDSADVVAVLGLYDTGSAARGSNMVHT